MEITHIKKDEKSINTNELKKFVDIHNLKERTIDGFWVYLKNYNIEEDEEFELVFNNIDVTQLNVKIEKIALAISYQFDEPVNYIIVTAIIWFKGQEIAQYSSLFTLEGEDLDEYIKFYN